MADASKPKVSHSHGSKQKRAHSPDPLEGSSSSHGHSKKTRDRDPPNPHPLAPSSSKPSKDEERHHKAMERAFQKAKAGSGGEVNLLAVSSSAAPAPPTQVLLPVEPSHTEDVPSLSPDVSLQGETIAPDAASVFPLAVPTDSPRPSSDQTSQDTRGRSPEPPLTQPQPRSEHLPEITPALATLISDSIRQGIAQGLQQKASSSNISDYLSRHTHAVRSQPLAESSQHQDRAISPSKDSQASILSEEQAIIDQDLSDDEGLGPDQPAFVGLFHPQMFRSLLFKAQNITSLGASAPKAQDPSLVSDPASSLFEEPSIQTEVIPAPKVIFGRGTEAVEFPKFQSGA